jgi:hypothetical protein
MDGKRELCTCLKCSQNIFVEDGITCQGVYVHPRTRQKHRLEAGNDDQSLARSLIQLALEEFPSLAAKQPTNNQLEQPPPHSETSNSSKSEDPEYKPISINYRMYHS